MSGVRQRLGADERRAQLADAAVRVVAREGYANASLTAVAAEAGVAKGLLWHYFDDGDQLMQHAARRTLVTLRESVAHDIDLTVPVPEVIRAALVRAAALRDTHADELRALREIVQHLRTPEGQPRLGVEEYEETYSLQEDLFERGIAEGSIRPLDRRTMAVAYEGVVDAMLSYLDRHPEVDAADFAANVADVVLGGIAQPRRSAQRGSQVRERGMQE